LFCKDHYSKLKKSSILRFFFEFRPIFQALRQPSNLIDTLRPADVHFQLASSVLDYEEVFSTYASGDLTIELEAINPDSDSSQRDYPCPNRVVVTVTRQQPLYRLALFVDNSRLNLEGIVNSYDGNLLVDSNKNVLVDVQNITQAFSDLAKTMYIGPFRNIINVGTNEQYLDIKTGEVFTQQWQALKTGTVKRNNALTYKVTEDIRKMFGFSSLEIVTSESNRTLQLFVNGQSYKLGEMGAGLVGHVACLSPLFSDCRMGVARRWTTRAGLWS
jgi:hypothetical protein